MRRFQLLLVVALTIATAHAGVAVDLSYTFEPQSQSPTRAEAKIDSVQMGFGVPLAVTGQAGVDMVLEVVSVDAEGSGTLRATFGEMSASLLGEEQKPQQIDPVVMHVDRRGRLLEIASDEAPEMDLFASGGVPLQLVVLVAGVVEFPEHPVEVGEEWTLDRCQQLPDIGEVTMRITSRVESISDDEIVVLSDITASFPDFTTRNPLQDNEITLRNGVLTISGMRRTIDADANLLKSATAAMLFDCRAAMGGFAELPLTVSSSFVITPRLLDTAQAAR
ncbi:MAG: hypothetical protein GX131_14155 [candidate division WS1 bacterium]|nr:hypothetical protein [candidate division WS1 bacterium]